MKNNTVAINRMMRVCDSLIAVTALGHVFCCGLPLMLSILGIFSAATSYSLETITGITAVDEYEDFALYFATGIIVFSGLLQWVSARLDCHNTGCVHGSCSPAKRRSRRLFILSIALYAMSMFMHFMAH